MKKMIDREGRLQTLSFSFESDTIKNLDIYRLLRDIDSLGYHSYTVRRIAPFEKKALRSQ
jgi:hypothetical protein